MRISSLIALLLCVSISASGGFSAGEVLVCSLLAVLLAMPGLSAK